MFTGGNRVGGIALTFVLILILQVTEGCSSRFNQLPSNNSENTNSISQSTPTPSPSPTPTPSPSPLPQFGRKGISGVGIYVLAQDGSNIVVVTSSGTYASINGGSSFFASQGLPTTGVTSLVFFNHNIFAATINGLFFSDNGGATFARIYSGYINSDGRSFSIFKSVAVARDVVYLLVENLGLIASTDGGHSFSLLNERNETYFAYKMIASGNYVFTFVGGGVTVSSNGGLTFVESTFAQIDHSPTDICFDENTLYVSTSGGIFVSKDFGASYSKLTTAQGLPTNSLHRVFARGNSIYTIPDDGSLWASNDGGISFMNYGSNVGLPATGELTVGFGTSDILVGTSSGLYIAP